MTTYLVYQSPNAEKRRSEPIREDETARRRVLERQGWTVVERTSGAPAHGALVEPLSAGGDGAQPFLATFAFLSAEQRKALEDAGYADEAALRAATDEQLREVRGIGPAAARDLRKALAGKSGASPAE